MVHWNDLSMKCKIAHLREKMIDYTFLLLFAVAEVIILHCFTVKIALASLIFDSIMKISSLYEYKQSYHFVYMMSKSAMILGVLYLSFC